VLLGVYCGSALATLAALNLLANVSVHATSAAVPSCCPAAPAAVSLSTAGACGSIVTARICSCTRETEVGGVSSEAAHVRARPAR
jgi:hypothetical protein